MKRRTLFAVAVALLGVPLLPMPATALTPTTGSFVAYGVLVTPGWTSTAPGVVPDPSQWQTWPSRSWSLDNVVCAGVQPPSTASTTGGGPVCDFFFSGGAFGWCDLSKGSGSGFLYTGSGTVYVPSLRFTGGGRTLAVTGEAFTYGWGPLGSGELRGYVTGTITRHIPLFLGDAGCGVQDALVELTYVLQ